MTFFFVLAGRVHKSIGGHAGDFLPIPPAACYASADFFDSPKRDLMTEKSNKNEATAQFAKLQRADEAKSATADYEAAAAAVRAKTERLRALRLARDAAAASRAPAATQRKKQKKAKSAGLSEWLDEQSKEGRRS
jgi:hypothetical protein